MAFTRTLPRRLFWALTWGLGVAIGVAAGGWLTVVGGSGAPGTESLDFVGDLIVLPLIVGSCVAVVHFLGGLLVTALRRARPGDADDDDYEGEQAIGQ